MGIKINWDMLGIGTALACAIHCAVLPIFLTSLPFFGMEVIHNPAFEYGMIALAFLIGVNALYHGLRKHHHRILPIAVFVFGFILLLLKQAFSGHEIYLLIPAVLAIVSAHWMNYRYCRKANHCHTADCSH
jgi:hypothetical protein